MVSIGSIITGGFRLFREQPVAVLIWGVINGVLTAGSSMLVLTTAQAQLTAAQAGGGSPFALLRWMIPVYIAMLLIGLVVTAAAFRAVVRPEAGSAAFMRLGGDEGRLFVLALVWGVLNLILYIAMIALIAVAAGAVIASGNGSSPGPIVLLSILVVLPILALMIFFHIRLSPAIPLTIMRRQIVIGEAWRLTKGHFWALFTGYLVIVLLLAAGYMLVASVTMGSCWAAMANGGFNPRSIDAANQYRMSQMTMIGPLTIVGWLLSAAFGSVSYALWAGSVSTATLELLGVEDRDYAATFE